MLTVIAFLLRGRGRTVRSHPTALFGRIHRHGAGHVTSRFGRRLCSQSRCSSCRRRSRRCCRISSRCLCRCLRCCGRLLALALRVGRRCRSSRLFLCLLLFLLFLLVLRLRLLVARPLRPLGQLQLPLDLPARLHDVAPLDTLEDLRLALLLRQRIQPRSVRIVAHQVFVVPIVEFGIAATAAATAAVTVVAAVSIARLVLARCRLTRGSSSSTLAGLFRVGRYLTFFRLGPVTCVDRLFALHTSSSSCSGQCCVASGGCRHIGASFAIILLSFALRLGGGRWFSSLSLALCHRFRAGCFVLFLLLLLLVIVIIVRVRAGPGAGVRSGSGPVVTGMVRRGGRQAGCLLLLGQ